MDVKETKVADSLVAHGDADGNEAESEKPPGLDGGVKSVDVVDGGEEVEPKGENVQDPVGETFERRESETFGERISPEGSDVTGDVIRRPIIAPASGAVESFEAEDAASPSAPAASATAPAAPDSAAAAAASTTTTPRSRASRFSLLNESRLSIDNSPRFMKLPPAFKCVQICDHQSSAARPIADAATDSDPRPLGVVDDAAARGLSSANVNVGDDGVGLMVAPFEQDADARHEKAGDDEISEDAAARPAGSTIEAKPRIPLLEDEKLRWERVLARVGQEYDAQLELHRQLHRSELDALRAEIASRISEQEIGSFGTRLHDDNDDDDDNNKSRERKEERRSKNNVNDEPSGPERAEKAESSGRNSLTSQAAERGRRGGGGGDGRGQKQGGEKINSKNKLEVKKYLDAIESKKRGKFKSDESNDGGSNCVNDDNKNAAAAASTAAAAPPRRPLDRIDLPSKLNASSPAKQTLIEDPSLIKHSPSTTPSKQAHLDASFKSPFGKSSKTKRTPPSSSYHLQSLSVSPDVAEAVAAAGCSSTSSPQRLVEEKVDLRIDDDDDDDDDSCYLPEKKSNGNLLVLDSRALEKQKDDRSSRRRNGGRSDLGEEKGGGGGGGTKTNGCRPLDGEVDGRIENETPIRAYLRKSTSDDRKAALRLREELSARHSFRLAQRSFTFDAANNGVDEIEASPPASASSSTASARPPPIVFNADSLDEERDDDAGFVPRFRRDSIELVVDAASNPRRREDDAAARLRSSFDSFDLNADGHAPFPPLAPLPDYLLEAVELAPLYPSHRSVDASSTTPSISAAAASPRSTGSSYVESCPGVVVVGASNSSSDRINLREKHARHLADLRDYYEEEIRELREELERKGGGSVAAGAAAPLAPVAGTEGVADEASRRGTRRPEVSQSPVKKNTFTGSPARRRVSKNDSRGRRAIDDADEDDEETDRRTRGLEASLKDWAARYAGLERVNRKLVARLDDVMGFAEEMEKKAAALEERVDKEERMEEKMSQKANLVEELSEEIASLQDDNSTLRAELQSLAETNNELVKSLQASESRLVNCQSQLSDAAAKTSTLELDLRRLEREKNRLKQTSVSPGWGSNSVVEEGRGSESLERRSHRKRNAAHVGVTSWSLNPSTQTSPTRNAANFPMSTSWLQSDSSSLQAAAARLAGSARDAGRERPTSGDDHAYPAPSRGGGSGFSDSESEGRRYLKGSSSSSLTGNDVDDDANLDATLDVTLVEDYDVDDDDVTATRTSNSLSSNGGSSTRRPFSVSGKASSSTTSPPPQMRADDAGPRDLPCRRRRHHPNQTAPVQLQQQQPHQRSVSEPHRRHDHDARSRGTRTPTSGRDSGADRDSGARRDLGISIDDHLLLISEYEEKLDSLAKEKGRLESCLSRLPASASRHSAKFSSGIVSRQARLERESLENRLDVVEKEMGRTRMVLRSYNVLRK